MKTLYYPAWGQLEVCDRPSPELAKDEVLLEVAACGICGSELETFRNRSPRRTPPLIMGHEFCGTVVETKDTSRRFYAGQKAISHSIVTCGSCRPCWRGNTHLCENRQVFGMHRQGAFAELVNVPASCLVPWPEDLTSTAACLAEPLANGLHVTNLVRALEPQTVVILGAGPIGLMCQQAAQVVLGTATIVSDLVPERLEAARRLGATAVANPSKDDLAELVFQTTEDEGADVVIDAVGAEQTKKQSLDLVRSGGAVVWIGLHESTVSVDSYGVTLPEKTIFGSYAASITELKRAVALMASQQVEVRSWVQAFALEDGVEVFQRMAEARGRDIKAVLVASSKGDNS